MSPSATLTDEEKNRMLKIIWWTAHQPMFELRIICL